MEVSLDLLITALLNIAVLLGGAAYFHWSGRFKSNGIPPTNTVPTAPEPRAEVIREEMQPKQPAAPSAAKLAAREALRAAEEVTTPIKTDGCEYMGTVKRYSERNGMGFIVCDDTRTKYDVDVRIFSNEYKAAELDVGDEVLFLLVPGLKSNDKRRQHPWATRVTRLRKSNGDASKTHLPDAKAHSSLNADASEFIPGGSRLNSAASEFVPCGDPLVFSGTSLNATAKEFVPTWENVAPKEATLRADAAEFVPAS